MKETTNNTPKVYAAISAIQHALKNGIPKDQKNAMQGYNFRGIDDIYDTVGPLLPEHGLLVLPRMTGWESTEHKNAKGNIMFRVKVDAEFDFIGVEDGSSHMVKMFGEAMDSSDKATNKAMSAAYKYAIIQAFAIPVTGEPDADSESAEAKAEAALPTRPAAQSPVLPPKTPPRSPRREETASMESMTWQGMIEKCEKHAGVAKSGKPYTLFRVTLDDGRTATTFDEELFNAAKGWDVLHEAMLQVAPNKRSSKPGTWELLNIQKVEDEVELYVERGEEKEEEWK